MNELRQWTQVEETEKKIWINGVISAHDIKKNLPAWIHSVQLQLDSHSATKTMGDSNFPNRPALGQLNLIE